VDISGSGYSEPPVVSISGVGTDASATANISGEVSSITITNRGRGYQTAPTISIEGGSGSGAAGTVSLTGAVISLTVVDGGRAWVGTPTLGFSGGGGASAAATVTAMDTILDQVTIVSGGTGYTSNPAISVTGGGGTGIVLRSRINGIVQTVTVTDPGGQFAVAPLITFAGGGNLRSPQAGLRYYRSASGLVAIGEQSTQTLAGMDRLRVVARAVVTNTAPSTTYQAAVLRAAGGGGYTPPTNIALIVDMWVRSVYYTIENGGAYTTAVDLLTANKAFIRAEAMAFWEANFPGVADATYSRDVGLMVDAVAADLSDYGVLYSLTCAIKQAFTTARGVNISAVNQGIDFVRDLALDIIQNNLIESPLTGLAVTATQVSTNYITVSDTTDLSADEAITFTGIASGENFGNLTGGTQYYVKDVVNGTTITVSLTPGGTVVNLLSATGTITLSKQITNDTLALQSGAVVALENNFNLIKETEL
jgi:hypothetical protein